VSLIRVRSCLRSPVPPERKVPERVAPVLGPLKKVVDGWLREALSAPRKQRHTATRIHQRLEEECQAQVSYSLVQRYVKARRPQILAEAGRGATKVFVEQVHDAGCEAEVDFGAVAVVLGGVRVTIPMFVLRLSFSGRAIHRCFVTEAQESFLAGHEIAFDLLGEVPTHRIRYDNLTAAVAKVLTGRTRVEQTRWAAFQSHVSRPGTALLVLMVRMRRVGWKGRWAASVGAG